MSLGRESLVLDSLAAILILAALIHSLGIVGDLSAPWDWDHFRDIASAQTALDGAPFSDQYYGGEWIWYNPLLPWVLAAGAALSGTEIEVLHVRSGPWLNLLGPIMFYLLSIRLVGRRAAFAALALYLFFLPGESGLGWAYATYSPWLWSNNLVEGIFFAAVLALSVASKKPTPLRAAFAGALMGLTFLAHTAPAMILVILAFAAFGSRWKLLLAAGAAALAVSSPFLYPIGWVYGFAVANPVPLSWEWTGVLTPEHLFRFLMIHAVLLVPAILGAVLVPHRLLVVWFIAALTLMSFAVLSEIVFIPAFHFWKWASAAAAILTGAAVGRVASLEPKLAPAVPIVVLVAVVLYWPLYVQREDFAFTRERPPSEIAAMRFLRSNFGPEAVILGDRSAAVFVIGPAGRKTVAPDAYLANPYVAHAERWHAGNHMLSAISERDAGLFNWLAGEWNVAGVVSAGERECNAAFRMLRPMARFGDLCISGTGKAVEVD